MQHRQPGTRTVFLLTLAMLVISSFKQPNNMQAKLLLNAGAALGEGSLWHPTEKKLYWVDIEGEALHIYDPVTRKDKQFPTGARVGTVVPVQDGGALVALQTGIYKIDTKTGKLTFIINPLKDSAIRFNDGKCDPAGRFWVGTLNMKGKPHDAVLYRLDKDKHLHLMLNNVTNSNGIVWSADKKTMYYIDTPTLTVVAFDYDDATGDISNRRVVIRIPPGEGFPDGMTIDSEGKLWVALWGGGAVTCWDPATGKQLQKIIVPAPNTSSCAFGGNDLRTLYITTARVGLSDEDLKKYPLSGSIFTARPGATGVPACFYKGDL